MAKYFQIWPSFWRGDRRRWPDDQKLLALYLLSCEHRSLEGYYFLPKGYVIADLGWEMTKVDEHLGALITCGFCSYDDDAQVVFVVKALEHDAPKGSKRVPGAVSALRSVPKSGLWPAFLAACAVHAPELAKALAEDADPSPDTPSEPYPPDGSGSTDTQSEALPYAGAHSSSSNSSNKPSPTAAAARGHIRVKAEEITTTLTGLARKCRLSAPSVDEVEALLLEHEERDASVALEKFREWCGRSTKPATVLGAFGHTLSAAPKRPVSVLPVQIHKAPTDEHRAAWATARTVLETRAPDVFAIYFAELTLVGVHGEGDEFVLSAPTHVVDWIASRHVPLLVDVLGRPVHLRPAAEGAAA